MIYVVMDREQPIAATCEYKTAWGIAKNLSPDNPSGCIVPVQYVVEGEVE